MSDEIPEQPELTTPRMRLRRLRRADAGLIALYCGNAGVACMTTSIPHPYPPGLAESFVERARDSRDGEAVWALDTGEDDMNGLIGLISLRLREGGVGDIGYWVAPAFQGAGYASEAVEALVGHAEAIGLEALTAQAFQDNLPSVKVLTRSGFAYEGEGALYSLARNTTVPTFRYRRALGGRT
jgi:RimJ/RimL family protein N-acetyltransferase